MDDDPLDFFLEYKNAGTPGTSVYRFVYTSSYPSINILVYKLSSTSESTTLCSKSIPNLRSITTLNNFALRGISTKSGVITFYVIYKFSYSPSITES